MMRPEIFSTIADHLQSGKPVIAEGSGTAYEDTGAIRLLLLLFNINYSAFLFVLTVY